MIGETEVSGSFVLVSTTQVILRSIQAAWKLILKLATQPIWTYLSTTRS